MSATLATADFAADYVWLADLIARQMTSKLPAHKYDQHEDIQADARLGLVHAANRFDDRDDVKFSTFATPRIRGAVIDGLRGRDHLSRGQRRHVTATDQARNRFVLREQRFPTTDEMAGELGLSPDEFATRAAAETREPVSIHAPAGDAEQDGTLADTIPDPENPFARIDASAHVTDSMRCLSSREHFVLWLRYWEDQHLHEIGALLGVSESRVCQIQRVALNKLHAEMQAAA